MLTAERPRSSLFAPTRDRLVLLMWIAALPFAFVEVRGALTVGTLSDSRASWAAWQHVPMYSGIPEQSGAFLYPPPFAQLVRPLVLLPWPVFAALWAVTAACVYAWLLRPVSAAWAVPLAVFALDDLRAGQVTWLLAVSVVLALTRSAVAWVVPLLTKVSPGLLGVAWLAARRDWRGLLMLGGTAAAVLAMSFAAAPGLWRDWFSMVQSSHGVAAPMRLLAALVVAVIAARLDGPWVMPLAALLASPVGGLYVLGYLCAVPRLLPASALAWANAPFGGVRATLRRALDLEPAADDHVTGERS